MNHPKPVLFIGHGWMAPHYNAIADGLKKRHGIIPVFAASGAADMPALARHGRAFARSVNLLEGFRPAKPGAEPELRAALGEFEARHPGMTMMLFVRMDRWLRNVGSQAHILSYLLHMANRLEALYAEEDWHATVGEWILAFEMIAYHLSSPRIPYLFPLPARFYDRFYLDPDFWFGWPRFQELFTRYLAEGVPEPTRSIASERLAQITQARARPTFVNRRVWRRGQEPLWRKFEPMRRRMALDELLYGVLKERYANPRTTDPMEAALPYKLFRYGRERIRQHRFETIDFLRELPKGPYSTYFLHYQPEATVDVLGWPTVDQDRLIEVIASSLPAGEMLLVKEQEWMVCRRPSDYYQRLLQLPNVRLVRDTIHPHDLIQGAQTVFSIVGTCSMEAYLYGVPAVIFGRVFFETVPGIHRVTDLHALPQTLRTLRAGHSRVEGGPLALLGAIHDASHAGVDLNAVDYPEVLEPENLANLVRGYAAALGLE